MENARQILIDAIDEADQKIHDQEGFLTKEMWGNNIIDTIIANKELFFSILNED